MTMDIECVYICLGGSFVLIAFIMLVVWIVFSCYRSQKRKKKSSQKQQKIENPLPLDKKDVATSPIVTRKSNERERRKHECCHSKHRARTPLNVKIEQEERAKEAVAYPPKSPRSSSSPLSHSLPEVHPKTAEKCVNSLSLKKAKSKPNIDNKDIFQPSVQISTGLESTSGYVRMTGASPLMPKNNKHFSPTKLDNDACRSNFDQQSVNSCLRSKTASGPNSPTVGNASPIIIRNKKVGMQKGSLGNITEELYSQESLYVDGKSVFDKNVVIAHETGI